MSIHIESWQATIVTAIILLLIISKWGGQLPKTFHLDEWLGAVVVVFGIAGPLYRTPRFGQLARKVQTTVNGAATGAGLDLRNTGFVVVSMLVVVGVFMWFRKANGGLWPTIALAIATLPLFTNAGMQQADAWYVDHVGAALFRLLIEGINWLAGGVPT